MTVIDRPDTAQAAGPAVDRTAEQTRTEAARTYELDRAHVFHSWSAQATIDPMVITRAEGSCVWDGEGRKYLDFSSQLVNTNVGHQHPRVIQAIKDQAETIATLNPAHAVKPRSEAAAIIAELAPEGMDYVFFTNGGADANENAVRMARLHTGRHKVLSAYRSYHGATSLAINLTGDPRRIPNENAGEGTVHFFPPHTYRSHFDAADDAEEARRALKHLEDVIMFEGPHTIAAIILESIPGTAGIYAPPPGYLEGVRELTRRHGILLIADEVMAGFGRTGSWFAFQHWNIVPDLITFAKGVNSGYVPLGGVVLSNEVKRSFDHASYPGGLTYSGHPLAAAAAVATIQAMQDEKMVDNAARLGNDIIRPTLERMKESHPSVGDVRGMGCFWAIELVKNRETREPLAPYGGSSEAMAATLAKIREYGVLPFANFNRIHVVPPLNISDAELVRGLQAIDWALEISDTFVE